MTFVSVALFRRNGQQVFRPPRREHVTDATQARKAASRYWNARISAPDVLDRIIVVEPVGGAVRVSARDCSSAEWKTQYVHIADAAKHAHLAACLRELGVQQAEPPMPRVLLINGYTYRRDDAEEV